MRQQFIRHINERYKKINIENYLYYTFNNKINIKKFDPNLLSMDKRSFKNFDGVIYNTKYITMKSLDSENIDNENLICLFLIM